MVNLPHQQRLLRLCPAARVDVFHDADPFDKLAMLIDHRQATSHAPTIGTIAQADTILHLDWPLLGHGRHPGGRRWSDIVDVEHIKPAGAS